MIRSSSNNNKRATSDEDTRPQPQLGCSWCGRLAREDSRCWVPWEQWLFTMPGFLEHGKHQFDNIDCLYTYCKIVYPHGVTIHEAIVERSRARYNRAPSYQPSTMRLTPPLVTPAAAPASEDEEEDDCYQQPLDFSGLLGAFDDDVDDISFIRPVPEIPDGATWPRHSDLNPLWKSTVHPEPMTLGGL